MALPDLSALLVDWITVLYRGTPNAVVRFLDAVDACLPDGWVRDREKERTLSGLYLRRWYRFDLTGDMPLQVWFDLTTPSRVRGGSWLVPYLPLASEQIRVTQSLAQLSNNVESAAGENEVLGTRPEFGPRSVVTSTAERLFTRLADTADGQWPLRERDQELWFELITGCLAEHVAFNEVELTRWVEDSGWSSEVAPSLVDRFFADSRLWAKRLEALAR